VRRWARRLCTVLVLVLVGMLGYGAVTFGQVWWAAGGDSREPTQAIVVLGAAQYDGEPSPVLARRLDHAHELWQADVAPTIVVTGGKQQGDRFTEARASYEYLRDLGVPDGAILREEDGTNTWEQLAAAARFLRARDITGVVLVSDDYHSFRLDAIAGELGLDAQISPVGSGLSALGELKALLRETAAVALGRIVGYRRLVNLDDKVNEVRDG
jgi:uncharacterized SAM-binding protein YcdF (DUF218 family)